MLIMYCHLFMDSLGVKTIVTRVSKGNVFILVSLNVRQPHLGTPLQIATTALTRHDLNVTFITEYLKACPYLNTIY